ncbi:Bax inhibitor-1/YccA family protein [Corynebacterium tuberculostearicum]|uniref:Bax inhibitor-1/YccA family protein n=1 Tax=Corynebacterium tuberculostearicum TaxID=38304 RepID=UPI0026540988|nr:Bax inhibitor-1/YccA family protein [Corynebacterium tuberculostearicum]MDN8596682.1 Bax inhibitor-1/YccA family protein [Corynebacterium tuberculostearicum]MDV2430905.1 Bax inhibitor-1/YccA family protein [Corynebacterium tuberculostearicum]
MSSLTENSSRQNSGYEDVSTRPMTVDDVVTKTGITLGVIIVAAAINFALGMLVSPGIAMALTLVGGIGGFITVLVASFGKKWGSAAVTLIYAVFEGLFVGGFSLMFANVNFQGEGGMAIIGQAIVGTIGVFIGMLIVYKTGAVKVTPKFTKILFGLIAGVAVMALVNFLGAIFFDFNPLRDGGPIAIIFSLVCIVLGALSFLTDFDQADRMIRAGAPSKNAWGVALGLAVTLVWLYTEILRLLSYFQRD